MDADRQSDTLAGTHLRILPRKIGRDAALEYIADAWERRVNFERRRAATVGALAQADRRGPQQDRRAVGIDAMIDAAERRVADAHRRLAILQDYHAYLSALLPVGAASCDGTLRHTEAYFQERTRAVDLSQVVTLLAVLDAHCDCGALLAFAGLPP